MPLQIEIPVTETSQVGAARRAAIKLAEGIGLSEVDQYRVGIVATELGTNLVRHAKQGRVLIQELPSAMGSILEMMSIDSGPGIGNVEQALQDGFSTAGTPGNGLGAIQRLSDEFDIYSQREQGTVVLCRIWPARREPSSPVELNWGGISLPAPLEPECGDCWRLFDQDGRYSIMVADGLGHGILAAEASTKAREVLESAPWTAPQEFVQQANRALVGTRGAALAIARYDRGGSSLFYAGIGNISGTLFTNGRSRGLCSLNGIVGGVAPKVREFEYPVEPQDLLVMHSDGLQSRWTFDNYLGLSMRHPAVIAGVLIRDFRRGRDDVTVVVVRLGSRKARMA